MLSANRTCAKNVQTNRTTYPLTGSVQKSHALLRVINNLSALLFCIGWVASCRSRSPCQHGIIRSYRAVKLKITFCYAIKYAIQQPCVFTKPFDIIEFFHINDIKIHRKVVVFILFLPYLSIRYTKQLNNNHPIKKSHK